MSPYTINTTSPASMPLPSLDAELLRLRTKLVEASLSFQLRREEIQLDPSLASETYLAWVGRNRKFCALIITRLAEVKAEHARRTYPSQLAVMERRIHELERRVTELERPL